MYLVSVMLMRLVFVRLVSYMIKMSYTLSCVESYVFLCQGVVLYVRLPDAVEKFRLLYSRLVSP